MSYRVYLVLYKNNEEISSNQIFGNNIFPTEGEERFYDDYNAKIINGSETYFVQNLLINQSVLFTSYNLYKWLLEKNALENIYNLSLKNKYKIKISGF